MSLEVSPRTIRLLAVCVLSVIPALSFVGADAVAGAAAESLPSVATTITPVLESSVPPGIEDALTVEIEGAGSPKTGWPVNLNAPGSGFPYTPTLFDIDGDGAAEIFLTGGQTFGLRGDGSFLPGWPTTEHAYMGYGTNEQKPGPSAADLDGDGSPEVMWSERDWWAGSAHMWTFNGRRGDGSNLPGYPQYAPDDYSNALDVPFVLGDSDGDGILEAWGPHTLGNNFVHYRLSRLDHMGQRVFTRDINPSGNILNLHFGDVDGDGHEEFFAISWEDPWLRLYAFTPTGADAPGYPRTLSTLSGGYLCFGPPVLLDLDLDGDLEILFGYNVGSSSRVYAVHHDGTPIGGFPVVLATSSQLFYLGLGDLTGDGVPELIALDNHLGGAYRAHALTFPSMTPLAGWPFSVAHWPHGFPCVADVDGNGRQDLCISTEGGQVLAIGSDGALLPGFPKQMANGSISGVAAGDIDGDGLFELVAATWNGLVYAWDTTGPALPGRADWPMRGVDARYTGIYKRTSTVSVEQDLTAASRLHVLPNPARVGAEILLTGSGLAGGLTRLEILDVRGRRVGTAPAFEGGRAIWRPAPDLAPGVYLIRGRAGAETYQARVVLVK